MRKTANSNILSLRYASDEMNYTFSRKNEALKEREFWLTVLKGQKELGMNVPDGAIDAYEISMKNIYFDRIKEIELETKHDVVAKARAYNEVASSVSGREYQELHQGMTSKDLTDNVDQILIKDASKLVFGKYVSILNKFSQKAKEYEDIITTGRTHNQVAMATIMGKRFSSWGEELHRYVLKLEDFIENYPSRGIKGAIGNRTEMIKRLGSREKARKLEKNVARHYGFKKIWENTDQVYPRSLDYELLTNLALCTAPCERASIAIRLLGGYNLLNEGFGKKQTGSSRMPHKRNQRSSERNCGFAELIKMYAEGASRMSGNQWLEGDVSESVIRRVIIPDSFYASDGICETTLTILNQMEIYPKVIKAELKKYSPFLATGEILSEATRKGMGREDAHEKIRQHSIKEWKNMTENPTYEIELVENLGNDKDFILDSFGIKALIDDIEGSIGDAKSQINSFVRKVDGFIAKYPTEAKYEPKPIL